MGESKQVKVDNWGIFFLQRLQTFFNKTYFCDLTLQFEDNVQLKVHRLVMNACTEYFQVLEQTCEIMNDCLIMPSDLQADVVVPIVNFMYTGILEFQTSIFDRLYSTARLMNMTVLTKLLDAQKVPISPIHKPLNKRSPISPITWNLQGKKIAPKTIDSDLPETLPGRKLPIWKRKSVPSIPYRSDFITGLPDPLAPKYFRSSVDESPKPTRFEWPEDDDTNFDSFDEISYTSKPIILPQREKSPKPSTSSNNFEELKKTSVKRPASPLYSDSKKVNIQDVKEYIKEQKLRSDYIDYDDAEAADNDLQTYENDNNDTDEDKEVNSEENTNKSILKTDISTPNNKRVRFSLEGKENAAKITKTTPATTKTTNPGVDHTKIITEILKKYPHLVKKNKNIKLKILSKGSNTGLKQVGAPAKVTKPQQTTKVSYMVMKPGDTNTQTDVKKDGHWSCQKCSNPNPLIFDTYYNYRKHMTEIHQEKVDSQMCNICGHISRKQNLLMYHKFTKHNIEPPASYQFPKCKHCDYVALSPNMLQRHDIMHTHQNLICTECNTHFPKLNALITHIQLTGHTNKNQTHDCTYCTKKFISEETLLNHIKNNHKIEAKRDNLISQLEEQELVEERKENVITAEEIDALDEPQEKPKEKIKILSDVKVTTVKNNKLQPVKIIADEETAQKSQLEPSSEAESLSNVASGIAASLGLVNTIVVLDENQFILQSQDGNQENIITGNPQNIILPDVNNIQNLVSQHQVITTDTNAIISQATLNKNDITSTDELVMVLTDHDYSDASNNVITSENSNIVVLYSHPVPGQDGQFISQPGNIMLNSEMGLVEVGSNYAVANAIPIEQKCEESIELIQQEINNHETDQTDNQEKVQILQFEDQQEEIQKEIQEPESMDVDIPQEQLQEITESSTAEEQQQTVDLIEDQQIIDHQVVELTNEQPETNEQELSSEQLLKETLKTKIHKNLELSLPPQSGSLIEDHIEEAQSFIDNNYQEPMEIEESIEMIKEEIRRNSTEKGSEGEDVPPDMPQEIEEHPQALQTIEEEPEPENSEKLNQNEQTEVQTLQQESTDVEKVSEIEQQEYEPMEVDSAKLSIIAENQETVVLDDVQQSENLDHPDLLTEEQENTEQQIQENVEQEQDIQENLEQNIQDNLEQDRQDNLEQDIQDNVEQDRQDNVEQDIQDNVEQDIQENIEQDIQENIEQDIQDNVEQDMQENIEQDIQDNVEQDIQDNLEQETQESVEREIEENVGQEIEENVEHGVQENTELGVDVDNQEIKSQQPIIAVLEDTEQSIPEDGEKRLVSESIELELQETQSEKEIATENIETVDDTTQESQDTIEETKIIQNSKQAVLKNPKISNLLDDWDDGDTDSQQSETKVNEEDGRRVVSTLINDWEDEEDT